MRIVKVAKAIVLGIFVMVASPALAIDSVYTGLFSSDAISGYDSVAYFTEGEPVKGSSDHKLKWNGATWKFASAENKALFEADPEKYAPQYGGYCAYAVSQNTTASSEPDNWHIKDGKLYLNYNDEIAERWLSKRDEFILDADKNWPKVLE